MDVSFIDTIFGSFVPIAPEIILIVAALIMPALFFVTKNGKACAAFALIMIALSGLIVGLMMHDGGFYGV
ncbi:MAG: NADH-quinone oxidoreductase subunit N, partial [Candidatus Methanomethylophilaceae archaeon]